MNIYFGKNMSKTIDQINKAILDYAGENLAQINSLIGEANDINQRDSLGQPAANVAAFHGHNDILQLLIEKGADVTSNPGYQGYRPIHCAAKSGHLSTVRMLIEQGAEVDVLVAPVEAVGRHTRIRSLENQVGSTPLHLAARMGKLAVVKYLLEQSANVNAHETDTGTTPMHEAVNGWVAMGKIPNYERKLKMRESYIEVIRLLIENGADMELTDEDGATPNMLAMVNTDETDEEQIDALLAILAA